ncbi:MAG TPA: hypothetical protein VK911_02550 [Vicinamibacterales bacterium]|nr:hypothetical protein [Vicinamibacterales bacterium]
MHALSNGLVGAAALTAVHQAARRYVPDAPRMDVVGMRAFARLFRLAGVDPPGGERLYALTMAGDLLSNGIYYSAVGSSGSKAVWPRAVALGLAAGVGAVVLPEPLGLGKPPHIERPRTRLLTVALYLTGALVAAAAASRGRPEKPPHIRRATGALAARYSPDQPPGKVRGPRGGSPKAR